jgi:hypothetical protein
MTRLPAARAEDVDRMRELSPEDRNPQIALSTKVAIGIDEIAPTAARSDVWTKRMHKRRTHSILILLSMTAVVGIGQTLQPVPPRNVDPSSHSSTATATTESAQFTVLKEKADAGDPQAQYQLGNAYADGRGVKADYVEALQWWRRAAQRGHAKAQNEVGVAYVHGH